MSFDSVTEQIAHFIGTFDLTIEKARLRDQYEEFTAMRRKAELDELENPAKIRIKSDLELDPGKYDPLPYRFDTPPATPELPPLSDGPEFETVVALAPPVSSGPPLPEATAAIAATFVIEQKLEIVTELIGSAVTYTFQKIFLRDNDVVGEGEFRDVDQLIAQTEAAAQVAASMHAFAVPSFSISDYLSVEYVESLAEEMLAPINAEVEGAVVYQFHGEDAMGVIVNGEHVDEAPVWDDLLPQHHQPDEEDEDETPDAMPAEWDQEDDDEFADGHTVIAGGNLAINEVSATVAWVDAPYIAVGGKSIELTMVSQVAVVSDIDKGTNGGSGTNVVHSSTIKVEGKSAPWLKQGSSDDDAPAFVHVDWITTDLIVANFVKQSIDATDIDHIDTEINATTTLYALGDNELIDVTNILQLGSYYDLIMIEGDMISVDAFIQTHVLMDDDVVTGGLPGLIDGSDENLVMNEVSLLTEGEDTHQAMQASMADAMALGEDDMTALEDALMSDPMFAGMEQMRVLKIDGSLIQVNVTEQSTILADQDDVHLHGPHADETEVLAGSNAMLNAANITKAGVDSVVMAQDGVFSDLLLHQASLIDMPTNEEITEMTNEAIAALMEDAGMPGYENGIGPSGNDLTPNEMANSSDGLQTMLA
ncbi:type I secretion protein [uncultured Ruegeria sp.]|uniref:type I secretion protein n=1 Tax=uncultured Ruegeria sp. TaxID=259304 RepID=UPI0026123FE2|nr:type I secretion protein [uncultured Ruegeria sp.]